MKIKLIGICLMFVVGCEINHQEYSIEAFMNTTSIGSASFSPDEKSILIRSDAFPDGPMTNKVFILRPINAIPVTWTFMKWILIHLNPK